MISQGTNIKVLVIGLDGATFDVIYPLIRRGKLPTFSKLLKIGCHGRLKSIFPPWSAPAWVSLVTGKNPGKHSVFAFFVLKSMSYNEIDSVVNSKCIKSKTIWNILSAVGKKVIIINVPVTYPPCPVNGILVSGFLTPSPSCEFTYPRWFKKFLKRYKIDISGAFKYITVPIPSMNLNKLYNELLDMLEARKELVITLLKTLKWDFFMVVFMTLDRVQHFFWHTHENKAEHTDIVSEFYSKIDVMLSEILKLVDENTIVMIVSDHGFGRAPRKLFHVNTWLVNLGLLRLKRSILLRMRVIILGLLRKISTPLIEILGNFIKRLSISLSEKLRNAVMWSETSITKVINWSETIAYGSIFGIRINLKGKKPKGVVEPDKYEKIREFIIRKLMQVEDPETNSKVVKIALKREDMYKGMFTALAPDIIIMLNDDYRLSLTLESNCITKRPFRLPTGDHRAHGIFIVFGKGIRQGVDLNEVSILDIAPTILHIMGIPIPKDMDGQVIKELFE